MRIAVLILGLLLGLLMFLQTFVVYALSGLADHPASGTAAAMGLLMALLWLVGCALVIPAPLVSVVAFDRLAGRVCLSRELPGPRAVGRCLARPVGDERPRLDR